MASDLTVLGSTVGADEWDPEATDLPESGPQERRVPPHLFNEWPNVARRLRSAPRLRLFLDFDGTLTPIRNRPSDVSLDAPIREQLGRLADREGVAVSIITGRRESDVRRRIGLPGIEYLGVHGWEGGDRRPPPASTLRLMRRARLFLKPSLAGLAGIWIENKGAAFTVHYRNAPSASVRWARIAVRALLRIFHPALRLVSGKKAWEIFPCDFAGKCGTVLAILASQPAGVLPIYVGDDAIDEEVFRALDDAITVRVGRKARTYAQFRLAGPSEVGKFLHGIDGERARRLRTVSVSSSALPS